MTRRIFESPSAFKTSLEHRLRTRAQGTALARTRQLLVYDRFLARLFADDADDVVLKGGLALELRCARARSTRDVDLRMTGRPDENLERLQTAGRLDLGDFLTFEVVADPKHPTIDADGLIYEGRRYRVQAMLAGTPYGRPFGTDVAFAEPIVGEPEILHGEPWLEFIQVPATRVRAYPLLTHLAEKLHAYTLPRAQPNSRVKDLPDIALLAGVRELSAEALRSALRSTFMHRATHALPDRIPEPPTSWAAPYRELAIEHDLEWRTLPELFVVVQAFLDPALAASGGIWNPEHWRWE